MEARQRLDTLGTAAHFQARVHRLTHINPYQPASTRINFPMHIKLKKLSPGARVPSYATEGAACFDLHTTHRGQVPALESTTFHTGLAVEVPDGHVLLIYSRSGHGFNHGLRLGNCVGILDSDYRGEVMVKLHNDRHTPFSFETGDRIAQAMLVPVLRVTFEVVDELTDTARGAGGFGSTGTGVQA